MLVGTKKAMTKMGDLFKDFSEKLMSPDSSTKIETCSY